MGGTDGEQRACRVPRTRVRVAPGPQRRARVCRRALLSLRVLSCPARTCSLATAEVRVMKRPADPVFFLVLPIMFLCWNFFLPPEQGGTRVSGRASEGRTSGRRATRSPRATDALVFDAALGILLLLVASGFAHHSCGWLRSSRSLATGGRVQRCRARRRRTPVSPRRTRNLLQSYSHCVLEA